MAIVTVGIDLAKNDAADAAAICEAVLLLDVCV